MRDKTLERLVALTRGREGCDPSRLVLEPMLEKEKERKRENE